MSTEFLDPKVVLDRFGGIEGTAKKLKVPVSTIRNWAADGIPRLRDSEFLVLADEWGVPLTVQELQATRRK